MATVECEYTARTTAGGGTFWTQGSEDSHSSALPDRQRPAMVSQTGRLEGQQCSWSSQQVASYQQHNMQHFSNGMLCRRKAYMMGHHSLRTSST
jgi:hypothetical protein